MTARRVAARRLTFLLRFIPAGLLCSLAIAACYTGGQGTDPPPDTLYFPAGLAVSRGGTALYAVNSDFDLQWNGGTLQSYDLFRLRHDINAMILANLGAAPGPGGPLPDGGGPQCIGAYDGGCIPVAITPWAPSECASQSAVPQSNGARNPLGESCAPPVRSQPYEEFSASIGAFATQLQLARGVDSAGALRNRLFSPVRGNASLTWADVPMDDLTMIPMGDPSSVSPPAWLPAPFDPKAPGISPFVLDCGQDSGGRCGGDHQAGNTVTLSDTRGQTLPGEPFAMALTLDNTAVAITHQTGAETSVLLSGMYPLPSSSQPTVPSPTDGGVAGSSPGTLPPPSMQFVLSGVPQGGDGIAAVPHDDSPDSPAPGCEFFPPALQPPTCVRPSFLETNHTTAEVDLIRYYNDFGASIPRPFLVREVAYSINAALGGTDSRGIAIDPTPRMQCRHAVSGTRRTIAPSIGSITPADLLASEAPVDPCPTDPHGAACQAWIACGTVPSRVFIASRTPPALIIGEIGGPSTTGNGTFDPDHLTLRKVMALANGASTVYLAPIIDRLGNYELRVFIVSFDANQIFVYDPVNEVIENVINVGAGPFAMAFDPFDMQAVAQNAPALPDLRQTDPTHLKTYRFAYVALFTNSFLQVIDLDDSMPDVSARTFENVVFTLGTPTLPKGT